MDDDAIFDRPRREELQLIKAFLGITDPGKRQRVLRLAEQLADDASYEAAGLGAPRRPGPD
jgi:hypothetical protein